MKTKQNKKTDSFRRKTYFIVFGHGSGEVFNVHFTQKAMHNSILYAFHLYVFKAITILDFRAFFIKLS